MRQIFLDTETTGLEPSEGHRIIEIGCVEMIDRKLTGNNYHQYINPDRVVEDEAIEVHGITNQFLEDKPKFADIADDFYEFIKGAELIIHNAAFDVGFMNHEFKMLTRQSGKQYGEVKDYCSVLDTLKMARDKHPGQRNNLDALCKRYYVDNSNRTLHGALLDSEILADVYLAMTGGQTALLLGGEANADGSAAGSKKIPLELSTRPKVQLATDEEVATHNEYLDLIDKASDGAIWRQ